LETLYAVAGVLEVPLAMLLAGEEGHRGEGGGVAAARVPRRAEVVHQPGAGGVSDPPGAPGATSRPPQAGAGAVVVEDAVVRAELLRSHALPGGELAEVYLLTLSPGRRVSPGHGRGVREHLTLLAGAAVVGPEGEGVALAPGESASWDSSAPHCYETAGGAQGVLIITNPARHRTGG
jgi:hypothetical protein